MGLGQAAMTCPHDSYHVQCECRDWCAPPQRRAQHDRTRSLSITRWAYSRVVSANGLMWVERFVLRYLGDDWQLVLGDAG